MKSRVLKLILLALTLSPISLLAEKKCPGRLALVGRDDDRLPVIRERHDRREEISDAALRRLGQRMAERMSANEPRTVLDRPDGSSVPDFISP